MALLPNRNILDGTKVPATTTSEMKTALGSLRDYLAGLLGTDSTDTAAARTALVAAKSGANSDITSLSGLTTALSKAQGGTGVSTPRIMVQSVTFQTGALATGTTQIPFDNTIPQNTEGDQYMSLSITPTNALSTLEVEVSAVVSSSVANYIAAALFQDTLLGALTVSVQSTFQAGAPCTLTLNYSQVAGGTSATTFKVRIGCITAGTTTLNGISGGGGALFGGTANSKITIKEYLP